MPEGKGRADELGALWINEKDDGSKYMSGQITVNGEKVGIVVFKNNYKRRSNHPDYNILQKRGGNSGPQDVEPSGGKARQQKAVEETFEDDVPF